MWGSRNNVLLVYCLRVVGQLCQWFWAEANCCGVRAPVCMFQIEMCSVCYSQLSIIIFRQLNIGCILSLCGKQFSQNIGLYTFSMISLLGYCSKGNVLTIAHTLSFTVLINISISGTCFSWLVTFSIMPIYSICFWVFSNCPSTVCVIYENPLPYMPWSLVLGQSLLSISFHFY